MYYSYGAGTLARTLLMVIWKVLMSVYVYLLLVVVHPGSKSSINSWSFFMVSFSLVSSAAVLMLLSVLLLLSLE